MNFCASIDDVAEVRCFHMLRLRERWYMFSFEKRNPRGSIKHSFYNYVDQDNDPLGVADPFRNVGIMPVL